jgi:hypothetical protein
VADELEKIRAERVSKINELHERDVILDELR